MAANLATSANGQAMVASLRQSMWHGCGTIFQEEVSGQEMLKLANLNWDVLEAPVYADTGIMVNKAVGWDETTDSPVMGNVLENITKREIPGIKTVYRGDTGEPMGVVGTDYHVFQNSEMIQMFENLVNGHKIIYETAGGLGKTGDVVWVMAKIPDLKLDIKGDEIEQYMLISNGHTGNRRLMCHSTGIRVVCSNTLSMATAEFKNNIKKNKKKMDVNTGYAIRHTTNMMAMVNQVEQAYAKILGDFTITKEMFEAMCNVSVTTEMKNSFFEFIIDPTKDESEKAKEISKRGETRRLKKFELLEELYESPTNQTTASKDTVFGLYNVGVEYIDFHRQTRCNDETSDDSCRFESAAFGSGKALKDSIFVKAMELVG